MTDIYDIKNLVSSIPINFVYTAIILAVAMILYIFLINQKEETKIIKIKVKKENINDLIKDLEQNIDKFDKDTFYRKLDYILRLIVKEKYNKNIKNLSYKELNKLDIDNILKDFIKNIYFKEYAKNIDDNEEIRQKYVNLIKWLYWLSDS